MVATLSALVVEATAVGDLEAARIAHEAIGKLLASSSAVPIDAAEVIHLAGRRRSKTKQGDQR